MRLKLAFLALFLVVTSAAYAGTGGSCADCYGMGDKDPSGISSSLASHCYWQDSGKYGSCLPKDFSNTCETSTATYCPKKTSDCAPYCDPGGGGGGGGWGGGGGGECSGGGYCEPSCWDCGMMY
jgi:hypothetical protein